MEKGGMENNQMLQGGYGMVKLPFSEFIILKPNLYSTL